MTWKLPSLSALRTLDVAAKHLSFTKAALELNVTQSAVSRQIRQLEEYLEIMLFQRVKKKLVLTESGENYLREVRVGLTCIENATVDLLAQRNDKGILNIAAPPVFSVKWLIPRLVAFHKSYPDILITLSSRSKEFDFDAQSIDASIYYGCDDWPNVVSEPLLGNDLVPVCAPGYLKGKRRVVTLSDLSKHSLLQQTRRPNSWHDFFADQGIPAANAWAGPQFEHFYMLLQAAIAGLGVALMPRFLILDDLASSRLIEPVEHHFASRDSYRLVYPPSKRNNPKLELFKRWLVNESIHFKKQSAAQ
ncbi:LysR family transcriptional regulator [Pollutimonas subterranea]|uniref:LysR family transcriptional regulator n=1 Tax=Pollutimonas subterranea TaxID=2045210 RepID=A0A2N4U729_9BURK|nr:transcriptional regulator GcvA [Pollutimonas subterranea]PLC50825.1 LysR family transcriptional regulator [Pollutimonas subterranea]